MNYLTLNGIVDNILVTPEGVNQETGESYGGRHRVQLQIVKTLKNGQQQKEYQNLNVDDVGPFRAVEGKLVSVPVGAFADGRTIRFFHARNVSPALTLIEPSKAQGA